MILCNGLPKSGTCALTRAVELLGAEACHAHYEYGTRQVLPETYRHVLVKRDPRNVVISALRYFDRPITLSEFNGMFETWFVKDSPKYLPWLSNPAVLVIRYEDLIASAYAMRLIAQCIGVPYVEGAFERLPGHTVTWKPQHSDYRELGASVAPEILSQWGYA